MKFVKIFFVIFLVAIIAVGISSCVDKKNISDNYTDDAENTEVTISKKDTITDISTEIIETLNQTVVNELHTGGVGDEYDSPYDDYKYRAIYYSISAPFVDLVDESIYWNWLKNETPYKKYPLDNIEEMAIVAFIKRFNISREDFDKANEKYRQILLNSSGVAVMNPAEENPYYDRNVECAEIYNADIIYTFDNELINNYYLYVDPDEKEMSSEQYQ